MILKDECKKRGLRVVAFCEQVEVPEQTMRDWCKTKPKLVRALLDKCDYEQLILSYDQFHSQLNYYIDNNPRLLALKEEAKRNRIPG